MRGELGEGGEADILADGEAGEDAFGVTIVGDEADAGAPRRARISADRRVADQNLAAVAPVEAGERADELALALASMPVRPMISPARTTRSTLLKPAPLNPRASSTASPTAWPLGGKICSSGLPATSVTISLLVMSSRSRVSTSFAVAQHRDAVGDRHHLMQPVRDVDDRDALALERPHEIEKLLHVVLLERLGRLVEKEDARRNRERARDLDHMPLCERQIGHPAG